MTEEQRIVYYDSFDDDFAGTDIHAATVDASFPFVRRGVFWRALGWAVANLLGRPFSYCYCKLIRGLRIENRKAARAVRGKGCFLYGNHTGAYDAYLPYLAASPKRPYFLVNPDAVSLPGIRVLVQMLGAIPIPQGRSGMREFSAAMEQRVAERACVTVYPEAHIWPYCTFLRPFPDSVFHEPVKLGAPVLAMATTFRRRTGLAARVFRTPACTLTVGGPFYPDPALPAKAAQKKLADEVRAFLTECLSRPEQVEYIRYVRRDASADVVQERANVV